MSSQSINKAELVKLAVEQMEAELAQSISAAQQALEGATHDQSKAETQYDTLGLEHAYLAEGQSRRIESLKKDILLIEHMTITAIEEDEPIILNALIVVENGQKNTQTLFLCSSGGGIKLHTPQGEVILITPSSPLGDELLGRYQDDIFKWPNGENGTILSII